MSINNKLIRYTLVSAAMLSSFAIHASSQAVSSNPQHKNYALVDLGVAFPTKLAAADYGSQKPKSSLYYGVGFGSNCYDYLKLDVTLSRMEKAKFSKSLTDTVGTTYSVKQNFTSTMLMFNASAKANYGSLMPYVTAGLGAAYNEAKDYVTDQGTIKGANNMRLAWNLGFGAEYKVAGNTSVQLGYKYFDLNKAKTSTTFTSNDGKSVYNSGANTKLKAHVISMGMRYSF